MNPYPLIFEPIFKSRVWGGRRIEKQLRKRIPPGPIGESWELADLENDQSVVAVGPAKGKTLSQMVALWGDGLLGRAKLVDGRFPLLLKFLDAEKPLSVQVHPSEAAARRLGGEVRIKNEAWYVIDASPDSWILRGVKSGVDGDMLRTALKSGRAEQVLNRISIRPGHAYYIPSGTVHALGPGALIAEVQTPSDITYRLHDWNRIDPKTGALRELHIEEAMDSVLYEPVPPEAEHPEHVASVWTAITRLVRCESFVVERIRMVAGVEQTIPYEEMVAWMVLDGAGSIRCDGFKESIRFGVGDTVLLPAGLKGGRVAVEDVSTWLEISVPVVSSLGDLNRAERNSMRSDPRTNYVPLNVEREKND
jgi:mannose-6-phosphate isomerase